MGLERGHSVFEAGEGFQSRAPGRPCAVSGLVGVAVMLLLSVLCTGGASLFAEERGGGLAAGAKAPNFNLNLVTPVSGAAESIRLWDLIGSGAKGGPRLVVLSFFATWCKPCRAELPVLQRISSAHEPSQVRVMTVVVEGSDDRAQGEILKSVRAILAEDKISFPVLYDPFTKDLVASRYLGAQMELPGIYLIGSDGVIRGVYHEKRDDLPEIVDRLLKEMGTAAPGGNP